MAYGLGFEVEWAGALYKRKGGAEIGWRPAPEKITGAVTCWGKNGPEKCLVDLGYGTRTSTQSRRLLSEDAHFFVSL
jgi:hypothetical protein